MEELLIRTGVALRKWREEFKRRMHIRFIRRMRRRFAKVIAKDATPLGVEAANPLALPDQFFEVGSGDKKEA